jgi:hypothetical protein
MKRSFRHFTRLISTAGLGCLFVLTGCRHIETGHTRACKQLVKLSKELDSLLAEPLEDEEYRRTRLVLSGGLYGEKGEGFTTKSHSSAKIPLPAIKDRIGIMIGGSSDRNGDEEELLFEEDDGRERDYESFLRFFNKTDALVNWDFDVGLRYHNEIRYFFRLKGKHQGWLKCSQYRFIPRFYWRSHEGWGSKLRYEMDQRVATYAMVREFVEFKYTEVSDGVDIFTGAYLRTHPMDGLGMSLEMTHFMTTHPWKFHYVDFQYRVRSKLYWRWLELEVIPRFRLKRLEGDWELVPYLEAYLHLTFDARHLTKQGK